jgi:A/G-specific adenine glycosylase
MSSVLGRVIGTSIERKTSGKPPKPCCRRRPGDFNQAMMELGATVCLPPTSLFHLPCARPVCDARKSDQPARTIRQKKKKIAMRSIARELHFPGATPGTFVAHAGHVGAAGNTGRQ